MLFRFSNVSEEGEVYGMRGGSGGYLEFIFKYAAKELFNVTVDSIQYKQTKGHSMDYRIATLEVEGKEVLSFATAYGFKNIQNVLRRIKRGQKQFDFIEIMACPGG
jgi:iron only hydrogenase large subunit-like protein